jgi:hypothetical protein
METKDKTETKKKSTRTKAKTNTKPRIKKSLKTTEPTNTETEAEKKHEAEVMSACRTSLACRSAKCQPNEGRMKHEAEPITDSNCQLCTANCQLAKISPLSVQEQFQLIKTLLDEIAIQLVWLETNNAPIKVIMAMESWQLDTLHKKIQLEYLMRDMEII